MAYYDEAHIEKLIFIKNLKKKGLPLIAIQNMIATKNRKVMDLGNA